MTKTKTATVKVTCDRLPLCNGHVYYRDQVLTVGKEITAEEAANYQLAERVAKD